MRKYKKEAMKLIEQLRKNCTFKTICENYGQKEVSEFIDRMRTDQERNLSYPEECEIENILYQVKDIEPHN